MIYKLGHQNQTNEVYLFFEHFFLKMKFVLKLRHISVRRDIKKNRKKKNPTHLQFAGKFNSIM